MFLVASLIVQIGKPPNWAGGGVPLVKFGSLGNGIGLVNAVVALRVSLSVLKKGGYPVEKFPYEKGRMWSWKIPNPARNTVFPLPLSPHAKPSRGWKSFFAMEKKLSFETVVAGSVMCNRLAIFPLTSFGLVTAS